MTEFQELVKDAPEFALMERGELAIYAYAMYAAGAKMEAENVKLQASNEVIAEDHAALCEQNAKLRELLIDAYKDMDAWQMVIANSDQWGYGKGCLERLCELREAMRKLGIEVD